MDHLGCSGNGGFMRAVFFASAVHPAGKMEHASQIDRPQPRGGVLSDLDNDADAPAGNHFGVCLAVRMSVLFAAAWRVVSGFFDCGADCDADFLFGAVCFFTALSKNS